MEAGREQGSGVWALGVGCEVLDFFLGVVGVVGVCLTCKRRRGMSMCRRR